MEYEQSTSPTVKDKVRHNLCLSSCCFGSSSRRDVLDSPSSDDRPKLLCAPSTWLKSRAHEFPEIKDRCRHLISRIGGKHHRRHSTSADFRNICEKDSLEKPVPMPSSWKAPGQNSRKANFDFDGSLNRDGSGGIGIVIGIGFIDHIQATLASLRFIRGGERVG